MSNKSNKSSNKAAAAATSSTQNASNSTATSPLSASGGGPAATVAAAMVASSAGKSRPSVRMFNRYVIALGSIMLALLLCRISITPGHSSEDKDETISVAESDVTAVYRDDQFGTRVPVDSIVDILQHIGLFFDRTLNPDISLVSWVFNRQAGKLSKSLTEIATKMKQDWTQSIVKSEMTEKTGAVLDALISTIDTDSMENNRQQQHSQNVNMSQRALAGELKLLIKIISETLTGSQTSEQQTPSLRTANYIDYMKIKVDKVLLPDIVREYVVLFKRMGLEKILVGLKEILSEWRKEFRPES